MNPTSSTHQKFASSQRALKTARSAFFAAWAVGVIAFTSYLMSLHAVPLPVADSALPRPSKTEPPVANKDPWRAIHVLAAGCPCSDAIASHLLRRGPAADWDETVYVASVDTSTSPAVQNLSTKLIARGFRVARISSTALQPDLGVRGAPWLLFRDSQGHTLYSGGYAALRPRAGMKIEDVTILHRLQSGIPVTPNPAFGCAIDPALQKQLDPLALKYAREQ